ncbi:MAG: OsmC family protein [Calditrichia bacterium]
MPRRTAEAVWKGNLVGGNGRMKLGKSRFEGAYSFASRFEEGEGTNPEELIAAAHAGCFSMALANALDKEGYPPQTISTMAEVNLAKTESGFAISDIRLNTEAEVENITDEKFLQIAENAKQNCPVSRALAAVPIHLNARLKKK